eukprot:8459403-Heterocapsa_arctica.AAC.1
MFHGCALNDFETRALAAFPEAGVQLQLTPTRPMNRRKRGLQETANILRLLLLVFADDTTIICRESQRITLERLLSETLADWGQEVHP